MNETMLKRSIVMVLLMLLFVLGLYLGNSTSYSVKVENDNPKEVRIDNEVLILNKFSFDKYKAMAGDKVSVNIDVSGSKLKSGSLKLVREDGRYTLNILIEDIDSSPYIILPDFIINGIYDIKSLTLVAYSSEETTFTKNFTTKTTGSGDIYYEFGKGIELEANINNVDIDLIKSIKLDRSTFLQGQKVGVSIDVDKDVRSIRLNFKHSDTYSGIYSYVNSISKNPYIVIAKSGKIGDYVLDNIYVETYNYGSVIYKNIEEEGSKYLGYDGNYSLLQANDENSSVVYYDNADIDQNAISSFKNSNVIKEIYIMAYDETVISSEVFASIIGSDKILHVICKDVEYVFEGKNIVNVKIFDATAEMKLAKNYKKIDTDGLVIKMSNGSLPGKAKLIIKENSLFDKAFSNKVINIYSYNENDDTYSIAYEGININNKTYQFEIEEGSTYLLTNNKMGNVKKTNTSKEENKDNKEKIEKEKDKSSNINTLLLVVIAFLLVILIILVVVLFKKKGMSKKEIATKEVDFEEVKEELKEDISEEEIIENIAKSNEESIEDEE